MPRRTNPPRTRDRDRFRWPVLGSVTLMLCSCTLGTLTKPGLTDAQFKKDMYECDRDARLAGLGIGVASVDMRLQCMEARDYVESH